jgi:hypothetical protein
MDSSALGFESRSDKPGMQRRRGKFVENVARFVVLNTGYIPPGRKAPEQTRPEVAPDRNRTVAKLRGAVARFLELERRLLPRREHDLFLKHPALGDMTLREWMRFHVVHTRHHLKQLDQRLR